MVIINRGPTGATTSPTIKRATRGGFGDLGSPSSA